ncbi:MAG TPA: hypothetical protein VLF67_02355 [Candidatus Saccharimonas sp.]|nr:hypothetical protein [Candidatus Saccharimonas sp.]
MSTLPNLNTLQARHHRTHRHFEQLHQVVISRITGFIGVLLVATSVALDAAGLNLAATITLCSAIGGLVVLTAGWFWFRWRAQKARSQFLAFLALNDYLGPPNPA